MQVYATPDLEFSQAGGFALSDHVWLFTLVALIFLLVMLMQTARDRFSEDGFSLTAKITLMTSLLVILAAASVGSLTYMVIRDLKISDEVIQFQLGVKEEIERLDRIIDELKHDVRYLHRHPQLKSIFEPLKQHSGSSHTNPILQSSLNRLAVGFRELLHSRPGYQQIRLVEASQQGNELVRVERKGDELVDVQTEALQPKAGEPYFKELLTWSSEHVYLSEVSLNREHGVVMSPRIPMLRGGMPVRSAGGQLLAFLIINVDISPLLSELINKERPNHAAYVTNEGGEILLFRESHQ